MPSDKPSDEKPSAETSKPASAPAATEAPKEIGGRKGPDPTRFGDWEKDGRCVDF